MELTTVAYIYTDKRIKKCYDGISLKEIMDNDPNLEISFEKKFDYKITCLIVVDFMNHFELLKKLKSDKTIVFEIWSTVHTTKMKKGKWFFSKMIEGERYDQIEVTIKRLNIMCTGEIYPDPDKRENKRYFVKSATGINYSLCLLPNTIFIIKEHRKIIEFGKTGESYGILVFPELNVVSSGNLISRYEWQYEDKIYHYFKITFESALEEGRIIEL